MARVQAGGAAGDAAAATAAGRAGPAAATTFVEAATLVSGTAGSAFAAAASAGREGLDESDTDYSDTSGDSRGEAARRRRRRRNRRDASGASSALPPARARAAAPEERPRSLPGFDLVNQATHALKGVANGDGSKAKKAAAYLGYRLITYTGLPMVANLVSAVISSFFFVFSFGQIDWINERNAGSWENLRRSVVYDLTCDVRQLGRVQSAHPGFYAVR